MIFTIFFIFDNLLLTVLHKPYTPNHNPTFKCTSSNFWFSILRQNHSHLYIIPYRVYLIRTMPKGIDWKSPEAFTRLLAAMVAAQDMKVRFSLQFWNMVNWILCYLSCTWSHGFELLTWFFLPLLYQNSWPSFTDFLFSVGLSQDRQHVRPRYVPWSSSSSFLSSIPLPLFLINSFGKNFNPQSSPSQPLSRAWQSLHDKLIFPAGATYDSIEGRFRIIKREAAILRGEIDKGERPEAPPRGGGANNPASTISTPASSFHALSEPAGKKVSTPRKQRTPKKAAIKPEDGTRVLTGRVSKTKSSPPKPPKMVKEEALGDDSIFDIGHEIQELANDTFIEALDQVDFDNVLHYDGAMAIWAH